MIGIFELRNFQGISTIDLKSEETIRYKQAFCVCGYNGAHPPFFEQDTQDPKLTYRVEDGTFEVQTRYSTMIATMKNWDKAPSGKYVALTQRCIPIRYSLDDESMMSLGAES